MRFDSRHPLTPQTPGQQARHTQGRAARRVACGLAASPRARAHHCLGPDRERTTALTVDQAADVATCHRALLGMTLLAMSTPTFDAMKQIAAAAAPMLKAAGFRKRRHTFNRSVADGLVHVVNFQMGSYDPSGRPDVLAGIQLNFHGLFTINLGVFVPDMDRMSSPRSSWINDPDCQLRMRIGELMPEPTDVWWPLDAEASQSSAIDALRDLGLTWLDRSPAGTPSSTCSMRARRMRLASTDRRSWTWPTCSSASATPPQPSSSCAATSPDLICTGSIASTSRRSTWRCGISGT
jgi:hypothetical protein